MSGWPTSQAWCRYNPDPELIGHPHGTNVLINRFGRWLTSRLPSLAARFYFLLCFFFISIVGCLASTTIFICRMRKINSLLERLKNDTRHPIKWADEVPPESLVRFLHLGLQRLRKGYEKWQELRIEDDIYFFGMGKTREGSLIR